MEQATAAPSARARAIVAGLLKSGRATGLAIGRNFIRLTAASGRATDGDYWVATNGTHVLRGQQPHTADELQAGFVASMARAGAEAVG